MCLYLLFSVIILLYIIMELMFALNFFPDFMFDVQFYVRSLFKLSSQNSDGRVLYSDWLSSKPTPAFQPSWADRGCSSNK